MAVLPGGRPLDAFVEEYSDHRPHRSLDRRATPATVYTSRPKATPSTGERDDDTRDRVRYDKVDRAGKITWRYQGQMYSVGIGRVSCVSVRVALGRFDQTTLEGSG